MRWQLPRATTMGGSTPAPVPSTRRLPGVVIVLALMTSGLQPAGAVSTELLLAPFGEAAGDVFGESVGTAGDVNGDGYDDLIVGARQNDAGGSNAGRAYLYYGGPGGDATADLAFTGEAANDAFGRSVGTAGDVNGDGFDDFIIGASGNDVGGSGAGAAYVYYGGPGADTTADLTLLGEAASDNFGVSVGTAGDVDGDGFDDVIVGAYTADTGGPGAGGAYVYYGGPGADTIADLTFTGEASGDFFGISVGTAGDVNGDGFDDLIVGAVFNEAAGVEAGRAYVFYGGPEADATADLILTAEAAGDRFGISVGTAGDFNGDGFDDVVVGADMNDSGGPDAGSAYVYYGGPATDAVADLTLTGEAAVDNFGFCVAAAGDANGDGFNDLIVGAQFNDAGGSAAGRAYVYYGGPGADAVADLTFTGAASGDSFGYSVAAAGDMNGDGFDDVVAAATRNDFGGSNAGRAYVYSAFPYRLQSPDGREQWVAGQPGVVRWQGHDVADLDVSLDAGVSWSTLASGVGGDVWNEHTVVTPGIPSEFALVRLTYSGQAPARSNSVTSAAPFRIVGRDRPPAAVDRLRLAPLGEATGDLFGQYVGTAGDLNGDGFDDLIVGANKNDAGGTDAGRAYVYHGGPGADATADLTLTGEAANDEFGIVGTAGDVNGDGFDDVIVGAYRNGAGGANAGRAYLYHGGPGADAVPDLTFTGVAGDQLGIAVGTAGDVNGDGFDDVIVGAYRNSAGGLFAGQAYVYYGGPGADAVADLTFTGEAADDALGISVGTAGDMNGDGFSDLIVGAAQNDAAGSNAGRAYVYYGGPGADEVADLTLTGEAPDDLFGSPVRSAGDVNGDGFDDVIVGAYRNDAGGTDAGRAYVFQGGPHADARADLILTGEAPGDFFGISAGTAGDVNGDGFDDLFVGAPINGIGGSLAGRAYVYYGGPGGDATPDLTFTGEAAGDVFGISGGTAGDVNGDGFDDLVVGAYFGAAAAGRAYVYDCNRYHVLTPAGGTTWNVGASESITWVGSEPADVWLSVDGGNHYSLLRSNVGGSASNSTGLTVPHQPSRFAKIRITPSDTNVTGSAESDTLFTIEASIALLSFQATVPAGSEAGRMIAWSTDPGPEDLAGYRLEKSGAGRSWQTLVNGTKETSYLDREDAAGARYRLSAINGLGAEYVLGETAVAPSVPLAVWPLPYRGGKLNVSFATLGGLGGGLGPAEVVVYSVTGRRVRTIARGDFKGGNHQATWNGLDQQGRTVSSGIYFVRVNTAGNVSSRKLVVLR